MYLLGRYDTNMTLKKYCLFSLALIILAALGTAVVIGFVHLINNQTLNATLRELNDRGFFAIVCSALVYGLIIAPCISLYKNRNNQ
jgi:hypothetical protein